MRTMGLRNTEFISLNKWVKALALRYKMKNSFLKACVLFVAFCCLVYNKQNQKNNNKKTQSKIIYETRNIKHN